jgi:hypothetical protein
MRSLEWFMSRVGRRIAAAVAERTASDARSAPAVKVALRHLWLDYRLRAERGERVESRDTGFRVFSQFDEDGIALWLLASLGDGPLLFVDLGAGNGVHASNCANLALNFGFHGLFVDANAALVERGRSFYVEHPDTSLFPPSFVTARVEPDTVNDVVRAAGFTGEIDLLSIDIDGNDYWVWDALTAVQPRVVVIETHPELGRRSLVAPYAEHPGHVPGQPAHLLGASPAAMTTLARRKGYRLVAANRFGFNLFYIRDSFAESLFPALAIDDLFRHPRARSRELSADALAGLPFIEP